MTMSFIRESASAAFQNVVCPLAKFALWDHPIQWAQVLPSWLTPQRQPREQAASLRHDDPRQLALNQFLRDHPLDTLRERAGIKIYKNGVGENPWVFKCDALPGWLVKMDDPYTPTSDRVFQAAKMRRIIQDQNMNLLYVPEKLLAQNPLPEKKDKDNRIVLAEELHLATGLEMEAFFRNPLNKQKIKQMLVQLFTLIIDSGHQDISLVNVGLIKSGPNEGKLALFDTSPMFMGGIERQIRIYDPDDATGTVRIMNAYMGLQECDPFISRPKDTIAGHLSQKLVKEVYEEVTVKKKRDCKCNIVKSVALRALLPLAVFSSIGLGLYYR